MNSCLPGVLWRENEINVLASLLDLKQPRLPSNIYVYGHPGTGKSYVLKKLLHSIEAHHALLNCVECYTTRLLWELILSQLLKDDWCAEKDRCDSFLDFILKLQSHFQPDEPIVIVQLNFPKYCEPIEKEEAAIDDLRKLWRNIEPHLKKAMQSVYLREVSSAQWEEGTNVSTKLTGLELPYYSKYLLIAAYLASYNPSSTDKKFFSKNAGRMRQKKNTVNLKDKERGQQHQVGPKAFPLERMLAIFYAIVDEKIVPNALLFTQISSLSTLKLLVPVKTPGLLDAPKYKCVASFSFLKQISKTVGFEIVKYLHDFA